MSIQEHTAWNNFTLKSDAFGASADGIKHAAAIANLFMGAANSGGLNSFLTSCHELGSQEVVDALNIVGAHVAARQLSRITTGLGGPLPPASAEERWEFLDRHWTDDLDDCDTLSTEADDELMRVLERHVGENMAYYLALAPNRPDAA